MDLLPQDTRLRLSEEERRYLRRHSPRLLSTLSLVRSLPVKSVLDIGSGSGVFLLLLPPAWRRVAVDSPFNASLARKRGFDSFGLDLEKEDLPLEENSFDLVTLLEVIEHIQNKEHVISEVYRVLKTNGHIIVTTPDAGIPIWWLRDRILDAPGIGKLIFRLRTGRFPDRLDSHKGCLSESELTDLLGSEGFVVAGRGRFKIFQPNDDIVLIGRKHSKASQNHPLTCNTFWQGSKT